MSQDKEMIRVQLKEIEEVTVWCFRALGYGPSYGAAAAKLVRDAEVFYAQGIQLLREVINRPSTEVRPVALVEDGEFKGEIDGLGQNLLVVGTSLVDFLVGRVKRRGQYVVHVGHVGGGEGVLPVLVGVAAEMGIHCGGAMGGKRWVARPEEGRVMRAVEEVEPLGEGVLSFGGVVNGVGDVGGEDFGGMWEAAVKRGVEVDYGMWREVKGVAEGILVDVSE